MKVELKDVTNKKVLVLNTKPTTSNTQTRAQGFPDLDKVNCLPTNSFMQTLFTQLNLILNGTNVSISDGHYAHKAFLENLLSFSNETKRTELLSELYYPDEANMHSDGESHSYRVRAKFMQKGIIELFGNLHHEMSSSDKYLPSNVPICLQLYRNRPENSLLVTGTLDTGVLESEYAINIQVAKLFVRRIKVHPSVLLAVEEKLKKTPALFPITRSEMKVYSMPTEHYQNFQLNSIYLGVLPRRIFVFFVDTKQIDALRRSAYEFKHHNCSTIKLTSEVFPTPKIITSDFENKHYAQAYQALLDCLGVTAASNGGRHNISLTMDDFIGNIYINV